MFHLGLRTTVSRNCLVGIRVDRRSR